MPNAPDRLHSVPDPMRSAITELQAFYGIAPAVGPGVVDVRSTGAKGDGVADDTTSITAAIAQAPDGGTVLFPFGNYRITRQLQVTGKRLTLFGQSGAVISEGAPIVGTGISGAMILVAGAASARSVIQGLECRGGESLAGFSGAADRQMCFLRIDATEGIRVHDLSIRNKTYGVVVSNASGSAVTDVSVVGFLTTIAAPGKNYNAAIMVEGGSRVRIARVNSRETGTVVIVGGSSSFGTISDCTGVLLKDNGIYVSSGIGWTVSGVKIDQLSGNGGSGIKLRGTGNSAIGCSVANVIGGGGISITGSGVDDGTGHNGSAAIVAGNFIFHVDRFGILLDQHVGLYARDCVISQNTLDDCAKAGAPFFPMAIHGSGHRVTDNTVSKSGGDGLALISGTPARTARGILVTGNQWRGPSPLGLQVTLAEDCVLSENTFVALAGPSIDLRLCRNTSVFGNNSGIINWAPAFPSQGGQCFGNSAKVAGDLRGLDSLSVR